MIPFFRLGFGIFMGNPITGYIMVLKTIGRKTNKFRFAPVNYAIEKGNIYCLAGFGPKTHWYLNLLSNHDVEVILPGGAHFGKAEVVTDPVEQVRVVRQVIKNAGFAGFWEGYNPFKATEKHLQKTLEKSPVLRIRPIGIGSGFADPGGWLWISMSVITIILIILFLTK